MRMSTLICGRETSARIGVAEGGGPPSHEFVILLKDEDGERFVIGWEQHDGSIWIIEEIPFTEDLVATYRVALTKATNIALQN